MVKILWEVRPLSPLPVFRHCKKCGRKTEYYSSGCFRVNAQGKSLDIWLIYRCSECDTTWNAEVYSRIHPQSLPRELLERFSANDRGLAERYAADETFLRGNGAEVGQPEYCIKGEELPFNTPVELTVRPEQIQVKLSAVMRKKLGLSQREYQAMLDHGEIKSKASFDLLKGKLKKEIQLEVIRRKGNQ